MSRTILLVTALLIVGLLTACGGSSRKKAIIIKDDAPAAAVNEDDGAGDGADAAGGDAADDATATAAIQGESTPSRIAILVVPGIGYSISGDMASLDQIDDLLRRMAKANRYADVQIRTHESGTASMIQPILDLTERHGLVNVTLHDGR